MRLLYDQNLSRRLVKSLADLFPDSAHVLLLGMDRVKDDVIWAHARANNLVLASKDFDFHERARAAGPPPKVIWLDCGNCPTRHIERLFRNHHSRIMEFASIEDADVVVIR